MGRYRYGVILDAGSSGTRVHIYEWLNNAEARDVGIAKLKFLPALNTKDSKWTLKVKPGISEFGDKLDSVGPDYLKELLDFAAGIVPEGDAKKTPIFLFATAGMRLMDDEPRNALLAEICSYMRDNSNFYLPDCDLHVQVISGETEGLYGWIAANYLVGGFNNPNEHQHGQGHHTYGFLEMGGASAQIAFAPNTTEAKKHANDLKLVRLRTLNGEQVEYRVFVTTFLGYGADKAHDTYNSQLIHPDATDNTISDPCLPIDLKATTDGLLLDAAAAEELGEKYLVGTGDFTECLHKTYPILDKEAVCKDSPCLFHGVHTPAIDFKINHFIGVSNFWHGVHDVFNMGHDHAAYDFQTYQTRVKEFCEKPWDEILKGIQDHQWGKKFEKSDAVEICFRASWLINVLHEGIGIPRTGGADGTGRNGTEEVYKAIKPSGFRQPFQAVDEIHDHDVEWTLGKMLLYAASEIPPASKNTLPVGFGDNNPGGAAKNFEHASAAVDEPPVPHDHFDNSFYTPPTPHTTPHTPQATAQPQSSLDLHRLFSAENLRRTPGFILFFLILLVISILLCGRERRASLFRKLSRPFRRDESRGGGAIQLGKKPGRGFPFGLGGWAGAAREQKYERLLEQGDIPNPSDFELHAMSSEDDDGASLSSKGSASSAGSSGESSSRVRTEATARKAGGASPRMVGAGFAEAVGGSRAASPSRGRGAGLAANKASID